MNKYYIQNGQCGTETAFKIIGAKWKPQILHLCHTNHRTTFGDLKQELSGITDAILLKQLRELLSDGMIEKIAVSQDRNRHVYKITNKTLELMDAMKLMETLADVCGYPTSGYQSKLEFVKKLIGTKWKSRIIWMIYNCPNIRFNKLLGSIEGLSHKVLIDQLGELIQYGIVAKLDYNKKNPHVEYSITDRGRIAYEIIQSLADWCRKYEFAGANVLILADQ